VRFAHSETITVRRPSSPAATGPRGDPLPWTTHTVDNCVFAPSVSTGASVSTEAVDRRDTVITGLTLFAPPDADIQATDRIVRPDGTLWEVEGMPGPWVTPFTGWAPGLQVAVKRVTG
jgi:hypothetical protein